jgi:CBS domain-containing protein
MISIKQILSEKTKPLTTVSPDDSVQKAVELMSERNVGAVLVVDGNKLIGMFTERDSLHKVTARDLNPRNLSVREVMTSKVRFVTPSMEVSQCLAIMTERFFRHLPVLDEQENLLGIVSIGDLVKAKISEQNFIIEQLERYIAT